MSGTKRPNKTVVWGTGCRMWTDSERSAHRANGPALEFQTGRKDWYKHGWSHRVGAPAVESLEGISWYLDGVLHWCPTPSEHARFYETFPKNG